MMLVDVPTWKYLEREPLPVVGPYQVRPSRMGYVWSVIDSRTGDVRATRGTEAEAQARADELNREEV